MTDASMTTSAAGKKGGGSRSARKLSAVRANGKRGGRPKGSQDKDTPERRAAAWAAWKRASTAAKLAGLSAQVRDLAPLASANTRSIKIRTRRLEKLITDKG